MHIVHSFLLRLTGRTGQVTAPTALSLMGGLGLLALALLLPDTAFDHASAATAVQRVAVVPGRSQQPISLRDRLVVGLQARLRSEVDFVEAVVDRVRTGQLPQRMVDETFFWARTHAAEARRGRSVRPIIYFQPVMRTRAQRIGVSL